MAKAKKKTDEPSFIKILEELEKERGIPKDEVLDALKEALEKSYKKNYLSNEAHVNCTIDHETGKIRMFEEREVVDDVKDEDLQLSIEEAQEIDPKYQLGDIVINEVPISVFGRLAAIQTKQLLRQKIREIEKIKLYDAFVVKKDLIITGTVDIVEERFAIVEIEETIPSTTDDVKTDDVNAKEKKGITLKTGALLTKKEQIPGETLVPGQRIKVYVQDVQNNPKGTSISVSRKDKRLVYRLFESEVPEIYQGKVIVKSVAREAGERSKIAVYTADPDIDPVGSCVGQKGLRVRAVVAELNHEMIDIVEWNEDPRIFIANALSPAKVVKTKLDIDEKNALVVVPDNQLSLAIGKRGQNARLAAHLTGWKIDIKSVSEIAELDIDMSEDGFDAEYYKAMLAAEEEAQKAAEEAAKAEEVEEIEDVKEEIIDEDIEELENESFDETVDDNESFDDEVIETPEEDEAEEFDDVEEDEEPEEDSAQTILPTEIILPNEIVEEEDEEHPEKYITVVSADEDDEYYDDDDYYDDDEDWEPDYDPKYDEDIDYDQYDEYYDK